MIKLVIIDIDDTLILTEKACFKVENRIAEGMGFLPMSRETHMKNWGTPLKEAIIERFPGIDAEVFAQKLKEQLPDLVRTGEMDAVSDTNVQTLEAIKKLGKRLAILTSRELYEMEHLLDTTHALNDKIEAFFHKDNSDYTKPNPKVFDKILSHFNVAPSEAVYVGDTLNDGLCAKAAGLHFVALLESGLKTKMDFASVPVDYFANIFSDVVSYVNAN